MFDNHAQTVKQPDIVFKRLTVSPLLMMILELCLMTIDTIEKDAMRLSTGKE